MVESLQTPSGMGRFLAALSLLLIPSIASADARQDIIDLRRGDTVSHQEFLGWTDDGQAISRRLVCSEGGAMWCRATIDALKPGAAQSSHVLLDNDGLDEVATPGDPKGPISASEATAFIRGEAKALGALGHLSPGSSTRDPEGIFGEIGGEPTEIYLRTSSHRTDEMALNLYISVRGPRGASIDLEHMVNAPWRVGDEQVLDARISPEGDSVWLAMHYTDGAMCWDGEDIELTIAVRGQVRAKLANAAGLRAYRAGELDEAAALFDQATVEDPTYAWGWFNRGALHSQRGEVEAAALSLTEAIALDPSHQERACGDDDYQALAETTEGAALMGCTYQEGC
jgi:hypothetical protein